MTAGMAGASVNSIVVWGLGMLGVTATLGAKLAPTLTPAWLYQRLIWGALWGLLFFLLPGAIAKSKSAIGQQGFLVSLGPTIAQLSYFFPASGQGWLGMQLGATVPLLVLCFNAVWGVVAATWVAGARQQRSHDQPTPSIST
jgi:hypothetical protein